MRRESYLSQPPLIEVYEVNSGTDIILRRNVEEVTKEEIQDGKTVRTKCFECDEVQYRYKGSITQEEVESRFDYWWDIADGLSEIEAADKESQTEGKPTAIERIEAVEKASAENSDQMTQTQEAICELYEMILGGGVV